MTRRKETQEELDRMIERAKEAAARECQALHPERGFKCLLLADHQGPHEWRYGEGSRSHYWTDSGGLYREPGARRVRTKKAG